MKVEVAVLGSLSLIVLKATLNLNKLHTGRQAGRQTRQADRQTGRQRRAGQGRAARVRRQCLEPIMPTCCSWESFEEGGSPAAEV